MIHTKLLASLRRDLHWEQLFSLVKNIPLLNLRSTRDEESVFLEISQKADFSLLSKRQRK